MIDYQSLKSSYIKNYSDYTNVQINLLDHMQSVFIREGENLLLNKLQPPFSSEYTFFYDNFNFLIPLLVEEYDRRQDIYCLDIENKLNPAVSVFSVDAIVHTWESVDDFILWLIAESGYLAS